MEYETHFLKNNDFKTVLGHGIFGGITGTGQINMNFYTDRIPIPKKLLLEVDPETGAIIAERDRESKSGTIREMQFGVLVDIDTAKGIVNWLQDKIDVIERTRKEDHNK